EILTLMMYAVCYKEQRKTEKSLAILLYLNRCVENSGENMSYYEDLYTRLGVAVAGVLNEVGRYNESEETSFKCMKISLENQNSRRLARNAYAIACNIEAQLSDVPEKMKKQKEQEAIAFLKQAVVATQITNDQRGEQHIKSYCYKSYSINV
ncbi:MAG: hypothetical protein IKL99_06710, partial [Oscillospiraceae bacterium]|nr:hypothetical protein [Oscillospiraceae bacterium]